MFFKKLKIMSVLRRIGSPGIYYNEYIHERNETHIICNTIMTQSNQVTLMNTVFFDIPPSRQRRRVDDTLFTRVIESRLTAVKLHRGQQ